MRWRNSGRTTGERQCEWPGCQYAKALAESEYCANHRKAMTAEEEACRADVRERIELFRQAHEDGTLTDLVELCLADPPALPIFRLAQLKKALDKAGSSKAWQKMLEGPRLCSCGAEIEQGRAGRPAKMCDACRVERDARKAERRKAEQIERDAQAMLDQQLIG